MSSMSGMSGDRLLRLRPEFSILENSTDRISNSLGAMPRSAADFLREFAETRLDAGFDTVDEILASRGGERWSNRPTVVT